MIILREYALKVPTYFVKACQGHVRRDSFVFAVPKVEGHCECFQSWCAVKDVSIGHGLLVIWDGFSFFRGRLYESRSKLQLRD